MDVTRAALRTMVRQITDELVRAKTWSPLQGTGLRQGVVTAEDFANRVCDVQIAAETLEEDGSAVITPGCPIIAGYIPMVGDTVWVMANGSDRLVLGSTGIGTPPVVDQPLTYLGINLTTSINTYTVYHTNSTPFVKRANATRVRIDLSASSYAITTANTEVRYAGRINGADHQVTSAFHNAINVHAASHGEEFVTGVPAGTYTVAASWRRLSGTGDLRMDPNDPITYSFSEVP